MTLEGTRELPAGDVTVEAVFTADGNAQGSGELELFVDGVSAGRTRLERTLFRHGLEPFEVGRDSITPIEPAYADRGAFEFTGEVESVVFALSR